MERVVHCQPSVRRPQTGVLVRALTYLLDLDATYRQHRALTSLDNHLRRDIGLPEVERRPVRWDPPEMMRMK